MVEKSSSISKFGCAGPRLTRLQNAVQTPPSGLARHAWRGIIPGRLPHSVKPSPEFYSGNSRGVLFVELPFYNTVVLAARGESGLLILPARGMKNTLTTRAARAAFFSCGSMRTALRA